MDYTHLSEFAVRPGALTLWRAELVAGSEWAADQRPLASVHVQHCRDTDSADPRPGRGRWIGTIFEMDAPFDAGHWRETARQWHARHEGLRTTLAGHDAPEPERLIIAAADIAVTGEPVPGITGSREINEYLTSALEFQLSPLQWPHCLLATVEHADTGDFTVLVAADHSVMDAYSQAIVILELRTLYRAVAGGEPVRESPTFGSSADFAQWERSTAAALTTECEPVRYWRRFLDGSGGLLPRFEPAITAGGDADGDRVQTSVSRKLMSLSDLEHVERAVTERGHRLSVAVFTALAIAYRRTFGYISLRAIMPIATRTDLRWLESMGWFVNVVPIDITLAPDLDPDSALESTRTVLRRSRIANDATWTRVLELLDCTDRPRFGISFLDIRVLPDYELVQSLRGHTLRAESYSADEVFFWIVRAADGLRLSTRFPASFPAVEMDRFLAEFTRAMREFAVETTATPAPDPATTHPAVPSASAVLHGGIRPGRTAGGGPCRTATAREPFALPSASGPAATDPVRAPRIPAPAPAQV
ncbi:condensation domain-containing protein [Nocardia niigatensis]|uniref:condensation domain-containing protein n=1 Tax=Nocardia niigatensis TaxID=209249 RepID=UPI0002E479DD|nr:condensation domain-containing protein [Nocardia niigatensis]